MSMLLDLQQWYCQSREELSLDHQCRLQDLQMDYEQRMAEIMIYAGAPSHGSSHGSGGTDTIYASGVATVKPSNHRRCSYCGQANHDESLACEFCGGRLE